MNYSWFLALFPLNSRLVVGFFDYFALTGFHHLTVHQDVRDSKSKPRPNGQDKFKPCALRANNTCSNLRIQLVDATSAGQPIELLDIDPEKLLVGI